MGIKIVRTPSETPNITNVDDIIPFRYAYGNQNGYVIGRGSELDGSYESGEFTVGSGRVVIQGVEVDIDANGISTTLNTASETRYFKIYLKVNLANNVTVLESHYSTVSYDEITDPTSSDLISGGDAYLLLYTLKLNGTTQAEKNKVVKLIEYINKNTTIENANNANKVQNVDLSDDNTSQFGDYIVSKKKLLWSGLLDVGSNGKIIQFSNAERLRGKTIEVVFRCMTGDWGYTHSIITPLENTNMRAGLFDTHDGYKFEIAVYTNEIRFYGTNASFRLKEIYEIIE